MSDYHTEIYHHEIPIDPSQLDVPVTEREGQDTYLSRFLDDAEICQGAAVLAREIDKFLAIPAVRKGKAAQLVILAGELALSRLKLERAIEELGVDLHG